MAGLILAVDPSVRECGFAILHIHDDGSRNWKWGLIKPQGFNYVGKLYDIAEMLTLHLDEAITEYVVEWPQFFNSAKGATAAVQGDTILLAGVSAFLMGYFQTRNATLRTAIEWKGSVSKQITLRRFLKVFDQKWHDLNHNVVDAVMILHDHCIRQGYIEYTHNLKDDYCVLVQ